MVSHLRARYRAPSRVRCPAASKAAPAEAVRALARGPKPLAVTGFGTAAYRGAGDRGGRVLEVVEYDPETKAVTLTPSS
ncbi:hypothetical protein STANM309S_01485 [Streptomyces tanashiensis]